MELLIVDPFEAVPEGRVNQNPGISRYVSGMFGDFSGFSLTQAIHIVSGSLSARQIHMPQTSGRNIGFGPGTIQTEGKAVWGCAISVTYSESYNRYMMGIPLGPSGYSYLTLQGYDLSFLGETATLAELQTGVYIYYEVLVDLDGGTFEVYANNNQVMSGAHQFAELRNVAYFANSSVSPSYTYVDDIYHLGGTAGPFTDRLGPVRATRAPLLSATETNFTPVGAATNINAVNKTTLSGDAFNRSPASNNKADLFKLDMSAIPNDKDIIAISNQLLYQKSDIGPRNLGIVSKYGANIEREELPMNLGVFGGHAPQIITELPGGGSLDYGKVEDMEFGYEVKA